jgi:hypothetical protein
MYQMVGITLHTTRTSQAFPLRTTTTIVDTLATTADTLATTVDAKAILDITPQGTFPKGPHMENTSQ